MLAVALNLQLNAAPETTLLLDDDFSSLSAAWQDLSLAVDWGNAATPDSAFEVQDGVLQLNPAINGWTSYTSATGLRTCTAIDFHRPEAQSGTWTIQATVPLQPDTPVFVRLRSQC